MSGALRRLRSLPGLLSIAIPAAVASHCAGYELAALGERWLGPLGGSGLGAGHHAHAHAHAATSGRIHAGHLPLLPLTTGALLIGALVVLVVLVGGRRAAGLRAPRLGALLSAQLGVLIAIEAAGAVAGMSPPAASVLIAVVLQVPVAVAMVQLARGARHLLVRLLRPTMRSVRAGTVHLSLTPRFAHRARTRWSMRPPGRGPPRPRLARTPAAVAQAF